MRYRALLVLLSGLIVSATVKGNGDALAGKKGHVPDKGESVPVIRKERQIQQKNWNEEAKQLVETEGLPPLREYHGKAVLGDVWVYNKGHEFLLTRWTAQERVSRTYDPSGELLETEKHFPKTEGDFITLRSYTGRRDGDKVNVWTIRKNGQDFEKVQRRGPRGKLLPATIHDKRQGYPLAEFIIEEAKKGDDRMADILATSLQKGLIPGQDAPPALIFARLMDRVAFKSEYVARVLVPALKQLHVKLDGFQWGELRKSIDANLGNLYEAGHFSNDVDKVKSTESQMLEGVAIFLKSIAR